MGKKNKDKNKSFNPAEFMELMRTKNWDVNDVYAMLEDAKASKTIGCSHTNSDGKPKLEPIDDEGYVYKCKKCGEIIDLHPIKLDDAKEAVETVANMVNQVKLFTSDANSDDKSIREMGRAAKTAARVFKVYETIAPGKKFKKKNKNKNKKHHNNGSDLVGGFGLYNLDSSRGNRR